MLRYVIGTVLFLIAISFVRAIVGIIQRAVTDEVKSAMTGDPQPASSGKAANPGPQTTLRKCVSCGTYKPEPAMIRYGTGDKSVFFCSADCERKAS